VYELLSEQTLLGRDQFCDICIPIHSISRQHARIVHHSKKFHLEDLGSLNGTFINGRRVNGRHELHDGDSIHLYETQLSFFIGAPPKASPSPSTQSVMLSEVKQAGRKSSQLIESVDPNSMSEASSQARLKAMLEMTRTLGRTLAIQDSLATILESAFEIFPEADRGYILLAEPGSRHLSVGASKRRGMDDAASTMGPLDPAMAQRVMKDGQGILITEDTKLRDSVLAPQVTSAMVVPLIGPTRKPLGLIHLEMIRPGRSFSHEDLEVLVSVATVAGQAVEHAQMHQAQLRLDRRDRELSTAKEVQRHFLPQKCPDRPGYRFFDYYCAAEDVGGDYFGYLELEDGRLAIALGDVSGKGVSAALLMARLCSEVRYCLATAASPSEAVASLNDGLLDPAISLGDHFVTFLLCELDTKNHQLTIVNAGHMPPICRREKSKLVEQLGSDQAGPPLGAQAGYQYQEYKTTLQAGDLLLAYTDGVSEATNPSDQMYGMQRVCDIVAVGPQQAERMGQCLLDDVQEFLDNRRQSDDICVLCFQRES
jgi:serine phosphatase RsbU (regulator of sigma subunit)